MLKIWRQVPYIKKSFMQGDLAVIVNPKERLVESQVIS